MARILLAESDRRIRCLMAGILADCGHAVEACSDAVEATAMLGTAVIDVVVSDMVLGSGGDAILGRHCAERGIPTFTLSGCEFHLERSAAELPPRLLEKPFRFADLSDVLDAVASHSGLALVADQVD